VVWINKKKWMNKQNKQNPQPQQRDGGALEDRYNELLYAVARKFPGESRHETALRYIRQAEEVPAGSWRQHKEDDA